MIPFRAPLFASLAGGAPVVGPGLALDFDYLGAAEEYTVPSGYTSATVWLWAGAGGNGNYNSGMWSGGGGWLSATFPVAAGDTLKFELGNGANGAPRGSGGAGGWPDGGGGAAGDTGCGGGGGSSRFYVNGALKAVSGGGGGSGGYVGGGHAGGGGGLTGQAGGGGTGGSQVAGGVDSSDTGNATKTGRSIVAFPGVQRTGGWGGSTGDITTFTGDDGGGGGGGYWGGGGGGGDGQSGGGGSSWTAGDATDVLHGQASTNIPAFAPLGYPLAGHGVESGNNGPAVAGRPGYAILFLGTPYEVAGQLTHDAGVNLAANEKMASKFTVPENAIVKWLCVGINSGTGNCRGVIYADNGGAGTTAVPTTLMGQSATIAAGGSGTTAVFDMDDLALPAGVYWFGIHAESAMNVAQQGSTFPLIRYKADTFAGGADTPWDAHAGTVNATLKASIVYAPA